MRPLNAEQALERPIRTDSLPTPGEDEPLFLPADARRLWYLGFLKPWADFQEMTLDFWTSNATRNVFDEMRVHPIVPPRRRDAALTDQDPGADLLKDFFSREVLEVVGGICNRILASRAMQEADVPTHLRLGKPSSDDMGDQPIKWNPVYVVRAESDDGDEEEIRLIGHVEYLGGRPGALSWAIKEAAKNSWGSLRCVLGEVAQYMLMQSIRYAFLTSSDQIIFLKINIVQRTTKTDKGKLVNTLKQCWLEYSSPIQYSDVLDLAKKTVPVKLALLYLLYLSSTAEWQLPIDADNSIKYGTTTAAGQKYVPPMFDFMRSK